MRQLLAGLALLAMAPGGSAPAADAPPQRVYLALGTAQNSSSSCLKELAAVFRNEVVRRKGLVAARTRGESDVAVEIAACRTRTGTETFGTVDGGTSFGSDRTTWVRGELSGNLGGYAKARLSVDLDDGRPIRQFTSGPEARPTDEALTEVVSAALDHIESPPRR
jgi:hypothetical protein